jgi:Uma2 family endonuclease
MSAESTTASAPLRMSEEVFLAEYADLKPSFEFVNGEVTQKPMTKPDHYAIAEELTVRLGLYWRQAGGGSSGPEPTVNVSRGTDRRYRVPDVAYWAPGKPRRVGEVFAPPTLAVEILSPGQTMTELRDKCREYRARGTDVCWLVNPRRRTVEVFDAERDGVALMAGGVLESPHLPGFELPLDELFAALDR